MALLAWLVVCLSCILFALNPVNCSSRLPLNLEGQLHHSGAPAPAKHSGSSEVAYVADSADVAGSALPDCSHACGSCTPCKRVTISYSCHRHVIMMSQPCPLAYRCMCDGKSYPVP